MAIDLRAPQAAQEQGVQPGAPAQSLWARLNSINLTSGGPGIAERMLFTERIELLLETGVSLPEAINVMRLQTEDPAMAAVLGSLIDAVGQGRSFASALSAHPKMFPQTYVSLVAAAEAGSFLPQVLAQLREMDERKNQMRTALVSALSYPAFLILFSIAVVIFMLVVVFPKFEDMFRSIHDQLPASTVFLLYLSDVLRNHWLLLLAATGGGVAGLGYWLRTPAGARAMDQVKMRTPVIKGIFIEAYLIQALSVIGMSLANGVPITVALRASQDIINNSFFAQFLQTLLHNVEQGRGLAIGFEEATFVPPMVRQMISTGEQTGNLAKVMRRVADFYSRELNKRLAAFAKAIEPIMLMVMGVVVGLLVASLILPIFKLSRGVH